MSKKQTRASITVRGLIHQRLDNYCKDEGLAISPTLEQWISEDLDARKIPIPTSPHVKSARPKPHPPAPSTDDMVASGVWEF